MADHGRLREPFRQLSQQRESDRMGFHVFLATEIMLFGGLATVLLVVRHLHPAAFVRASAELDVTLGTVNTVVLLTSSLAVALAVEFARRGAVRRTALLLASAASLGVAFLAVKAVEYGTECRQGLLPVLCHPTGLTDPAHRLFMNLYLISTGLHALHLLMGILLATGLSLRLALGGLRLPDQAVAVELPGLYWHFVDVVWLFLFPLLYLAR